MAGREYAWQSMTCWTSTSRVSASAIGSRTTAPGLSGGIALGLALIFGWKWYGQHREQQSQAGYASYAEAVKAIGGADLKAAQDKVAALQKHDADSIYTELALLQLAQAQVKAKQNDAALATLKAVEGRFAGQARTADLHAARLLNGRGQAATRRSSCWPPTTAPRRWKCAAMRWSWRGKRDQARETVSESLDQPGRGLAAAPDGRNQAHQRRRHAARVRGVDLMKVVVNMKRAAAVVALGGGPVRLQHGQGLVHRRQEGPPRRPPPSRSSWRSSSPASRSTSSGRTSVGKG